MTLQPELQSLIADLPMTQKVVTAVLDIWPEHSTYLRKNFSRRSRQMLAATEEAATAAVRLMAGDEARFACAYQWTCDRLREEEIFFHREGRYRLTTFAEALSEVYSRPEFMAPYVDGLLLSQVLWYNHVGTFEMFINRVLGVTEHPFDYLEIGPGHGLMTWFAARHSLARNVEAWDVSATSLEKTRDALDRLGLVAPVTLREIDILAPTAPNTKVDIIVISEVLEHLETPEMALNFLRQVLHNDGRIFINVPLNSPSPDHIYLFAALSDIVEMVEAAGFRVIATEAFATQGHDVEKALRTRISVSTGLVAVPN